MGWWHVALEIRSTARTSSSTSPTSPSRNNGTDIFSIDLAPQKSAQAPSKSPDDGRRGGSSKPDATAPQPSDGTTQPDRSTAARPGWRKPTSAGDHKSPGDGTADSSSRARTNDSQGSHDAARSDEAAQQQAAQQQAAQQQTAQAQSAEQQARDAAAQAAEPSRANLLQILAQSLDPQGATPVATPTADNGSPGPTKKSGPSADPNAQALSVFTQALAAALGASSGAPVAGDASAQQSSSIADAPLVGDVGSKRATPGSELLSILGTDLAVDAKAGGAGAPLQTASPVAAASGQPQPDTNVGAPNLLPHLGLASHLTGSAAQAASGTTELRSTVGSAAWTDEIGTHLTWMTQKGLETGSLRVSPEHLGPVEVQISVQNGGASVWFGAHHPDTRTALEQALPRLREMFASQGMTLTDSGVSRESPRNQSRTASAPIAAISAQTGSEPVAVRVSLGLVDTYA